MQLYWFLVADGMNLGLFRMSPEQLLCFNALILLSANKHVPLSVHRFNVNVQPGTKLESGPASLHLCNNLLVIARDLPPTVIGQWKLSDLRRYGAVPNGFIFEGGTRCGYCKFMLLFFSSFSAIWSFWDANGFLDISFILFWQNTAFYSMRRIPW